MQKASLVGRTQTSAVAQSRSREQEMAIMRVSVAFTALYLTLESAMNEEDNIDNHIAFLEKARKLFGDVSTALTDLRSMNLNIATLKPISTPDKGNICLTMADAKLRLERIEVDISTFLAYAFREKTETKDVDVIIKFFKLERAEWEESENICARISDKVIPPVPRHEQKDFLATTCMGLADGYRLKAKKMDEGSNVIEVLKLARESIGKALDTLEKAPHLKKLQSEARRMELEIMCDAVDAHDAHITKLDQHTIGALRELDSSTSHSPEGKAELLSDLQDKLDMLLDGSKEAVSVFRDTQNLSKKLQETKSVLKSTKKSVLQSTKPDYSNNCKDIFSNISARLVEVATRNARYKIALASRRLEQLKVESSSDMDELAEFWQQGHTEIIHSLQTLFNHDGQKTEAAAPTDLEKCKALAGLVNHLKDKECAAQWLATLSKRREMPHAEQFAALEASCQELGNTAEDELKKSIAGLSKKEKTTFLQGKRQESGVQVSGWTQGAVQEAVAESEEEEKSARENQQARAPQTTTKGLETAKGKVAKLQEEVERSGSLSEFILKEQGPFSQFDAIFGPAIEKQEHTVNVLKDIIARLSKLRSPSAHLIEEVKELKADLRHRVTALASMQRQRVDAAKNLPPSGPALDFLLEEGQVARVELTENRKKLKGITITAQGPTPADYMDEHRIFIKGSAQPFVLHTHFRKADALLEEKTASHLKFKDAAGEDVRNMIRLDILEKLHSRFPVRNA